MDVSRSYFWDGWNIVEIPEHLSRELLNLKVHIYQTEGYPRLEDRDLYYEHVSKLLQHQKREDSNNWLLYYSDPISKELVETLNAEKIGKAPRPVVKFSPRQTTALMTKYLQKKLGKSLVKFQERFEEPSELKNERLGISVIRTRAPEIKVIGYGDGKVYIAIRYKVKESPTINLWELDKDTLYFVVELLKEQLKKQKPIRIKSPLAKSRTYSYLLRVLSGNEAKTFLESLLNSSNVNRRRDYQKIEKSIRSIHPNKSPLDSEYVFIAVPPRRYSKTLFSLCSTSPPSPACLEDTLIFTDLNTQLIMDTVVESLLFGEESDIVQWRQDILSTYSRTISYSLKYLSFRKVMPNAVVVPDKKVLMVKTEDNGVKRSWGLRGLLLKDDPKWGVFDDSIIPFTRRDENLRIFVYYPEKLKSTIKDSLFEKRLKSLASGIYDKAFSGNVEIIQRPIEGISWNSMGKLSNLDEYSIHILEDIEANLGGPNDSHLVIPILPERKGLVQFHTLRTKLLTEYNHKIAVQGIQVAGLNDPFRSYSSLLQTAPKLGIYFYSLDPTHPGINVQNYDLLLGVDVTRKYEANQRSLAASVVLMTPEGIPKGAVVVSQDTDRESVDLTSLFERILTHKTVLREIRRKRVGVLLARDGFVTTREEGSIEPSLMEFPNLELDMVEIVKETGTRAWLSYFKPSYVEMPYGEITQYLVIAHRGMRIQNSYFVKPYAIRRYYHAADTEGKNGPFTAPVSLVHYLIYLHKLNYTTYWDSLISLPAPVYFAHKCSNFIRKFGVERIPIDNALFFV